MYDVIVIGGGIVGTSTAYHLARAGAKALLIDRHDAGRATDAGAGILSPETAGVTSDPSWFEYAVSCVDYYDTLIPMLRADEAGETGYKRCGKLTVAFEDDERAPFEIAKRVVFERQARRGTPSDDDLHLVSSEQAQAYFPALAPSLGAIYYRGGARVDGRMINAAMRVAAKRHGLRHNAASVEKLIVVDGRVTGVQVDGETISAGKIIITGGAWSAAFGEQLGVHIPVEPMRGQIIHLSLPGVDTSDWPVITAFHGHYMVAWDDSRVVVGATYEKGSGFNINTTAAGIHEVLTDGLRMAPGLADAQLKEIRVGLRPATEDGLPVLGEVPGVEGVFLATGMGATGLQLGPYSGKLAADWATDTPIDTDISAFNVLRFAKQGAS